MISREVHSIYTKPMEYLNWSETPISFSRDDHWVHLPDPGSYPLVVAPTVNKVKLRKVLIDGGAALNIIFINTLRDMGCDVSKLVPSKDPFYGVIPGMASYPIGRVTFPVTFGKPDNFRTEYLTFEVADFNSSYHAILGRPMLAKFMAIPNHTYLVMKMPGPQGVLSIRGDFQAAFACDNDSVKLAIALELKRDQILLLEDSKKLPPGKNTVPEQIPTDTALSPNTKTKQISLGLEDPTKTVVVGVDLDPK